MRYTQVILQDGNDLIIRMHDEQGHIVSVRTWEGAAQYVQSASAKRGFVTLMVPASAQLNIKA